MAHINNIIPFTADTGHKQRQDDYLDSVLDDIKLALQHLLETGEETIIDLTNHPCDEKCEQALKNILGKGDVTASLNIFGEDSIIETGIHGVWWVYHINDRGDILTRALYITYVPSLLPAQRDDVEYGINVLSRRQYSQV